MLVSYPRFRASVADGELTLVGWHPGLKRMGSVAPMLRVCERRGVAIADLTIEGEVPAERELIVTFLTDGPPADAARRVLVEWAQALAYRRVWFSDEMVDLGCEPASLGEVRASCPACRSEWSESLPDFWAGARSAGCFPTCCLVCGALMAQWQLCA